MTAEKVALALEIALTAFNVVTRLESAQDIVDGMCRTRYGAMAVAFARRLGLDPVGLVQHAEDLMRQSLEKAARK